MKRAATAWAVALGMPLALDYWLLRQGHKTLSSHAREHKLATAVVLGYFAFHFYGRPSKFDPLHYLASISRPIEGRPINTEER